MSLLLLKTKDLTWQDHTLNIEVMLAPTRSQLLLNKHKTLTAKCQKMKELYERQRSTCIKDYVLDKRLMERYRKRLRMRMHEISEMARAQSTKERKVMPAPEPVEDRQLSAPVTRQQSTPAEVSSARDQSRVRPPQEEQKPVKFFITEAGTLTSMLPRLAAASGPKDKRRKHRRKQTQREDSPEIPARSKTVTFSIPSRSGVIQRHPPRQEPHPRSAPTHLSHGCSEAESVSISKAQRPLNTKVAAFLEDLKRFNEEPPTPTPTPVEVLAELGLKKAPSPRHPQSWQDATQTPAWRRKLSSLPSTSSARPMTAMSSARP